MKKTWKTFTSQIYTKFCANLTSRQIIQHKFLASLGKRVLICFVFPVAGKSRKWESIGLRKAMVETQMEEGENNYHNLFINRDPF
jgi:hypothetical protein